VTEQYYSALDRGTFSDLKLVCGDGKEFNVHKVVLCGHSSFFHSACTIDMKVSHGKDLVASALLIYIRM